jgi:hypothetical protein
LFHFIHVSNIASSTCLWLVNVVLERIQVAKINHLCLKLQVHNPTNLLHFQHSIGLEKLFDLQEKFKRLTNTKTRSSSLLYEAANLGTEQNPKNINLGKNCTHVERATFMKLLREFKDVFAWTYEDLKTYDKRIIQHIIPLKEDANPFQQKLRKMHPSIEPLVKKELNKLLTTKIIFPISHTTWVANLVPVRKKSGDIRICIYFRNLNRANLKDNYPILAKEQILQSVFGSTMLSLLDGFFGYN